MLYSLIKEHKNNRGEATIKLIERFTPLIDKLSRCSYYKEDTKSELVLFMITLLNKISIDDNKFIEDKYIISYISKSLKNHYILLNKKDCIYNNNETLYGEYYFNNSYDNTFDEIIFNDFIKSLTERERQVLTNKYLFNYSEADIARILNISRQSINKTHRRAIEKLKKSYVLN